MKRYIARNVLIGGLTSLVLLTICFANSPLGAHASKTAGGPKPSDHRDGPILIANNTLGFVIGQTLRVTVANVGTGSDHDRRPPTAQVMVSLLDAQARVIAQSGQVQIPRDEFRFFDFDRAALNLPGEQGTGRLQVRARVVMSVAEPSRFTDDLKGAGSLVPSLELIDNSTGKTEVLSGEQCLVFFLGGTTSN